jgi:hypothetical protein
MTATATFQVTDFPIQPTDVEHAGAAPAGYLSLNAMGSLPDVEYEGFEPDMGSDDGGEGIEAVSLYGISV